VVWRSATCFPASSTDRAAISTIAPRTHTDRRDAESGRCNGLNRPSRPRASSSLTHSFMATSIHAETPWQPPPIAQSGPRHSMSGSRRRALSIRRDQQCNRTPGPTSPLEVNVTMPEVGLSRRMHKAASPSRRMHHNQQLCRGAKRPRDREPDELRGSRPVLRERGGETPPRHSTVLPCSGCKIGNTRVSRMDCVSAGCGVGTELRAPAGLIPARSG
jgi:hypothetical protein